MLLPIRKIETFVEKDSSGNDKLIPGTREVVKGRKVVDEAIDVFMVKAVRPFHKGFKDKEIDGEMSVIYLYSNREKGAIEIHAVENWRTLIEKINELRAGNPKAKKFSELPKGEHGTLVPNSVVEGD